MKPLVLAFHDVIARLVDAGVNERVLHVADAEYMLPTRKDVTERLRRPWEQLIKGQKYSANRWDCDDYALAACYWAKLWHAQQRTEDVGIAFGEVWVGDHAINVAVHKNGVCFYEPQMDSSGFTFSPLEIEPGEIRFLRI